VPLQIPPLLYPMVRPRTPHTFEPLIGSDEAAKLLGNIRVRTLQRYARHRRIPGYQIGGHWYFRASELDSWLRSQTANRQSEDWVFASPKMSGKQPYWPETMLKCYVQPIAKRLGITKKIGWHTFRRTLGTLLTAADETAKTMQGLMRHANAGITMNLYAQARTSVKRAAHLKVVEMIRPTTETVVVPSCSHAQQVSFGK
jgi:excisionase family DNA binding protein